MEHSGDNDRIANVFFIKALIQIISVVFSEIQRKVFKLR